jgi:nucleoside-diphosphate-sugar epimerase
MKHTILGAGGAIGNALAYELLSQFKDVRLVSRSKYWIPGAETVKADLTIYEDTLRALKGSDIVYLCVGLPYNSKVWAELWPKIMQNCIDACKSIKAKLIFFDNVYMYGNVEGRMTEQTPYNPRSRKGEVRTQVAMMLENEINRQNIKAIIARSADFYGPYASKTSIPYVLVIEKFMSNKKAQWLLDASVSHSFTYTIDCAKAILLLYNREECYQQTWHLPTDSPVSGETLIQIIANALELPPDYEVLNKWMIRTAGLFNRTVKESFEMLYQYESNYYFDSTKFNDYFNFRPTSYFEGISETIRTLEMKKENQIQPLFSDYKTVP